MEIKRVRYFSISGRDRPGELARFARTMMEAGVNLAGVWGFRKGGGQAEIIAIPADAEPFRKAAQRAGWTAEAGVCFHLTGEDRVGALSESLERVAQEGINLHALGAMGVEGRYSAYVWAQEKDVDRLGKILKG